MGRVGCVAEAPGAASRPSADRPVVMVTRVLVSVATCLVIALNVYLLIGIIT